MRMSYLWLWRVNRNLDGEERYEKGEEEGRRVGVLLHHVLRSKRPAPGRGDGRPTGTLSPSGNSVLGHLLILLIFFCCTVV